MPFSESKAESRETHKEAAKAWQSISREDMQHLMMSVERIATDSHLSNNNYVCPITLACVKDRTVNY